jgi:hypothetical protein
MSDRLGRTWSFHPTIAHRCLNHVADTCTPAVHPAASTEKEKGESAHITTMKNVPQHQNYTRLKKQKFKNLTKKMCVHL